MSNAFKVKPFIELEFLTTTRFQIETLLWAFVEQLKSKVTSLHETGFIPTSYRISLWIIVKN